MSDPVEILYEALTTPLGLVVETPDPVHLRQKLYQAKAADPAFKDLAILTSRTAPNSELWIVKKGATDETP